MTIGPIEAWERGEIHPMLTIDGRSLRVEDVVAVANGAAVSLDPLALPAISRSRQAVEQLVAEGRVVYGITTGFGRFKDRLIPTDQVKQLQVNLVRSHAAGVGPELDEKTVRAMLLARANTLALGYSGVRPVIIETLVAMLNKGIHPSVSQSRLTGCKRRPCSACPSRIGVDWRGGGADERPPQCQARTRLPDPTLRRWNCWPRRDLPYSTAPR